MAGLDTDDELAFMAADTAVRPPRADAALPAGVTDVAEGHASSTR